MHFSWNSLPLSDYHMSGSTPVDNIQTIALPTVFEFLFFEHASCANHLK
jgi:hypothetical protein